MANVAKMTGRNKSSYERCTPECCMCLSATAEYLPLDLAIPRFSKSPDFLVGPEASPSTIASWIFDW
jgi:hypothetical protein